MVKVGCGLGWIIVLSKSIFIWIKNGVMIMIGITIKVRIRIRVKIRVRVRVKVLDRNGDLLYRTI